MNTDTPPPTYPILTITHEDPRYPQIFYTLPTSIQPRTLYTRGNHALLGTHCIAIVGSRNATELGKQFAKIIARHFALLGYAIVSGGAQGIDFAAHQGAIDAGGSTIAILASSLQTRDLLNPGLCENILDSGGLLVSQYSAGRSEKNRFTDRDKLIAGMGLVTIAVQAERINPRSGHQSGTLTTLSRVHEYGRHIWCAMPAPEEKHLPQYQGLIAARNQFGAKFFSKKEYPVLEQELEDIAQQSLSWQWHLPPKLEQELRSLREEVTL